MPGRELPVRLGDDCVIADGCALADDCAPAGGATTDCAATHANETQSKPYGTFFMTVLKIRRVSTLPCLRR